MSLGYLWFCFLAEKFCECDNGKSCLVPKNQRVYFGCKRRFFDTELEAFGQWRPGNLKAEGRESLMGWFLTLWGCNRWEVRQVIVVIFRIEQLGWTWGEDVGKWGNRLGRRSLGGSRSSYGK